jgi:hypothetical protein
MTDSHPDRLSVDPLARVGQVVGAFLGGGGSEGLARKETVLRIKTRLRKNVLFARKNFPVLHAKTPLFSCESSLFREM